MKQGEITMSMEHEQINDKTVALSVRSAKMTGRILAQAMQAFLRKAKTPHDKHGEQSLKSLSKQGASLADIEITGKNIGTFKKTARKYNVDYALKRDDSTNPPKWIVFFKAKDDKAIDSAFKEYSKRILDPKEKKPSLLRRIAKIKEHLKAQPAPVKTKKRGGHEL